MPLLGAIAGAPLLGASYLGAIAGSAGRIITCTKCWKIRIDQNIKTTCRGNFKWEPAIRKVWRQAQAAPQLTTRLCKIWQGSKQEADRRFKVLVEQGIEPNPGPCRIMPSMQIKTIHVGGILGAWRALHTWNTDILLLQDTPFSAQELQAFTKAAKKKKYRTYHTAPETQSLRPNGGVTTLVPTRLRQRPLKHTAGNIQSCVIEGTVVFSSYAPPEQQHQQAANLLETLVAHKLEHIPWIVGGDHNEEPDNSTILTTIDAYGACTLPTGQCTRWDGRKEIDWFFTNKPCLFTQPTIDRQYKVSDHIAVNTTGCHGRY